MITYEQIQKANEAISTTSIQGKEYAEVNQRIKAFRMVHPSGAIVTEMLSNEGGVCVFRATIYDNEARVLGTGTAYEKEASNFINKTSYIENCETSAVGRALGMCGFGIDTSVASAEEVTNAINNQGEKAEPTTERKATPKQLEIISKVYVGEKLARLLEANGITAIEELSMTKASDLISKLNKKAEGKANG